MSGKSEITKGLVQLRDIIISGTGKPAEVGNAIRDVAEEEGSVSEKDLYGVSLSVLQYVESFASIAGEVLRFLFWFSFMILKNREKISMIF